MRSLVNYVASAGPIVPFKFEGAWTGVPVAPTEVEIADAREFDAPPSLGREGFALDRLDVRGVDYGDSADVQGRWRPAVLELVRRLTGATAAIGWGANVRFSERSARSKDTPVSAPARHVHGDFSVDWRPTDLLDNPTAPGANEALAPWLEAEGRWTWRCFNVWQQISPPPHDTPLCLCDVRSLSAEDIVIGRGTDPTGFSVDLSFYRPNPKHRWCYVSDMEPGDTLVFSALDVSAAPVAGRVPHTAFDNPSCPPEAPARSSIEARVLAIFPND